MGHGAYEQLASSSLPPLYIAYDTRLSETTEIFHNDIQGRFARGSRTSSSHGRVAALASECRDLLSQSRGMKLDRYSTGILIYGSPSIGSRRKSRHD